MLSRSVDFFGARYFTVDRRVLGLFRIGMGLVLLVDVLRRLPFAAMFFSDAGVLPSELVRGRPPGDEVVSLFFFLKTPLQAQLGMVVLAAIYVAYTLGYRTRVAQVLALLGYASLNARNVFVENRGHIEMSIALVWTLLLPLGDRYSVDSLMRRGPRPKGPVRSLAVFAITIQIAAIYALNAIQKEGVAWNGGQAVHYVLWQNRIATELAGWLRMHEPSWLSPAMTTATLWGEGLAAVLVLSPVGQRRAREIFLGLTLAIHAGIALTMNLWPHSYIIMLLNLLMLPKQTLEQMIRWPRLAGLRRFVVGTAVRRRRHEAPRTRVWHQVPAHRIVMAREGAIMVVLVAVLFRIGHDNAAFPAFLRPDDLGGLAPIISYPRLYRVGACSPKRR